jgi:hypothetical protein
MRDLKRANDNPTNLRILAGTEHAACHAASQTDAALVLTPVWAAHTSVGIRGARLLQRGQQLLQAHGLNQMKVEASLP